MPAKTREQKRAELEAREKAQEAQAQALEIKPTPVRISAKGRAPLTGRTIAAPCPVFPEQVDEEGNVHPALIVHFRVDLQHDFFDSLSKDSTFNDLAKAIASIAVKFENWDLLDAETLNPLPVPNPADWKSYLKLVLPRYGLTELAYWIMGPGVYLAGSQGRGVNPGDVYAKFDFPKVQDNLRHVFGDIVDQMPPIGGPGFHVALEESLPKN